MSSSEIINNLLKNVEKEKKESFQNLLERDSVDLECFKHNFMLTTTLRNYESLLLNLNLLVPFEDSYRKEIVKKLES